MKTPTVFFQGQMVKFSIATRVGVTRGTGIVRRLPPKKVSRGTGRLTVVDGDGKSWRPYPSECKPSKTAI